MLLLPHRVRKYPAPEGALRLNLDHVRLSTLQVRKHPAPEGALRPFQDMLTLTDGLESESTQHQKVH